MGTDLLTGDMLTQLPPELQVRISDYLDYHAAIRLSQTNKYFHQLIDVQQWPAIDEAALVAQAQHWPRHRIVHTVDDGNGGLCIRYKTYGLACYSCYHVLPLYRFARTQTRHHRAKISPEEGSEGNRKRACIQRGISKGSYRTATKVNAASSVEYYIEPMTGPLRLDQQDFVYCGICRVLHMAPGCGYPQVEGACAWCEMPFYPEARKGLDVREPNSVYFHCGLCEKEGLVFCRCQYTVDNQYAAHAVTLRKTGVGGACCEKMYECVMGEKNEIAGVKALEIIQAKRSSRAQEKEADVLEGDVQDALILLGL